MAGHLFGSIGQVNEYHLSDTQGGKVLTKAEKPLVIVEDRTLLNTLVDGLILRGHAVFDDNQGRFLTSHADI